MSHSEKIYLRLSHDDDGLKFHGDHAQDHFTVRFAGRPFVLLEGLYLENGGRADLFKALYEAVKEGKDVSAYGDDNLAALKKAHAECTKCFEAMVRMAKTGRTPLVMYVSKYDESRVKRAE
jgi:hypothetical protein